MTFTISNKDGSICISDNADDIMESIWSELIFLWVATIIYAHKASCYFAIQLCTCSTVMGQNLRILLSIASVTLPWNKTLWLLDIHY